MAQPARLLVETGRNRGDQIILDKEIITLGRVEDNDIVVDDGYASRHHAQITKRGGRYYVRDLDSKNGTYLDDELVLGETPLLDRQKLQVGDTAFTFQDTIITETMPIVPGICQNGLIVDEAAREVWIDSTQLEPPLTAKQFELLLYLWERQGEACSKDEIARRVWPECEGEVYDYSIDKMVSRLRARMGDDAESPRFIVTVRGYGYKLMVED